jgi:argininosuccinate lyase
LRRAGVPRRWTKPRQIESRIAGHLERGLSGSRASSTAADEDVHSFVERVLVERPGRLPAAGSTPGRSRNEQGVARSAPLCCGGDPRSAARRAGVVDALAAQAGSGRRRADCPRSTALSARRSRSWSAQFFLFARRAAQRDFARLQAARDEV